MNTEDFAKKSITQFKGLYARGLTDEVPEDHLSTATNVIFDKKGEVSTRYGSAVSMATTWQIKQFFLSTINANLLPITLDGSGNIYAGNNSTPVISHAHIVDFVGINMFNKTYILPICSQAGTGVVMWVYNGTTWRKAQGAAPTAGMTAATSATAGNVSIGVHEFAVSFITDTGFTTPPSPLVSYTAPGGFKVDLASIPTGPTGTVSRQIFVTQANLLTLFYLADGLISDNTTTTLTVDFFDTDLIDTADPLNDVLPSIPCGLNNGGLDQYDGRMLILGTDNDLVLVTNSGDAETVDGVAGFIQIPSENDGNVVSSTFQINGLLYFTKVGVWQTSDNGGVPSTWPLSLIDGGTGALLRGVSTITAAQSHLSTAESVLLADIEGLFVFNGVVVRPSLTWKIKDLWESLVNVNTLNQITVYINPFETQIFMTFHNSSTVLVGDYSDGLDPTNIKWSQFVFPDNVSCITLATMSDDDGEFGYFFRFSLIGVNGLYKYHSGISGDLAANSSSVGQNITTIVATGLVTFDTGSVNIFTAVRARIVNNSSVDLTVVPYISGQDPSYTAVPSWTVAQTPGLDYFRQINLMNEQFSLMLTSTDVNGGFTLKRIDIFGKPWFLSRPG